MTIEDRRSKTQTVPFRVDEFIRDLKDADAYFAEAIKDGRVEVMREALRVVRARLHELGAAQAG